MFVITTMVTALAMTQASADPTSKPTADDSASDTASEPTSDSVTEAETTDQAGPVAGEVTLIAGQSGTDGAGYSGDGGPAVDARLNDRLDVTVAPDGTTYLADRFNRRVRAIDADGTITTVVHALRSPNNDVDVAEGWIFSPSNTPLSVDTTDDGALIVGSKDDVSVLTPDGETTVLVGGGEDGLPDPGESMPGESTSIYEAVDVAAASDGSVYAYLGGAGRIIAIAPDGTVRTLAGGGEEASGDADGSRPGTDYSIGEAGGITVADTGPFAETVFFTAGGHATVMAISPDGMLDVFAGTGDAGFSGDGGPASDAMLSETVQALVVTPDGDLLIGDQHNEAIRRVDSDGVITTLRGAVGKVTSLDVLPGGDIAFTREAQALRLTVDGTSALEVTESVDGTAGSDPFAQEPAGGVVPLAGAAGEVSPPVGLQQNHDGPVQAGVAVDADGAVLFGDPVTATVRRAEADGSTSVVAGVWPLPEGTAADTPAAETVTADEHVMDGVEDLATLPDGTVLIAEHNRVWTLQDDGTMTALGVQGEELKAIRGIATDATGSIYLAAGDVVQRIAPDGTVETIGGGGERWAHEADGHPATEASLMRTTDVAVDSQGNVYLTHGDRPLVRRIAPDGTLTTVLGDSYRSEDEGGFTGDGGPGREAEVNTPVGLAVGPDDEVYVADTYNARVRRMNPDGTVTTVAGTGQLPDQQAPDGKGPDSPALETALGEPTSLALDTDGNLMISAARPERLLQLTGDGGLRVLADTSSEPADEQRPAMESLLPGIRDLAVGPDGVPHLGSHDGITTIDDRAIDINGAQTQRITSGALMAAAGQATVSRVYPDGRTVLIAGGGAATEPDEAVPALSLNLANGVTDVAAGPEDSLFILAVANSQTTSETGQSLYKVTADGLATPVELGGMTGLVAVAAGPDGVVYGLEGTSGQILRLDEQDAGTIVVAQDEESTGDLVDEPFGTATALPAGKPQDLVAGPQGDLFVAVGDGVLVVDPEEDTYSFHDGLWSGDQHNLRVAADPHGNAYLLSHHEGGQAAQVSALVRPAEITAPNEIPWTGIAVAGGGVAVLLGGLLIWRTRSPGPALPTGTGR